MMSGRHRAFARLNPFLSLVACSLVLAGCMSRPARRGDSTTSDPAATKHDAAAGKADDDKADKQEKIEKKEHELACARLELEVAKQATAADERDAHMRFVEAERKLEMATRDAESFKNVESVLANDEASLHIDEAKERLDEAKKSLEELMKSYEHEKLAEITKELVVSRGKAQVALAEQSLDLAQKKAAAVREVDQPKKQAELALAREKAEHDLNEARSKEERLANENRLKIMKAEQSVQENEHALARLASAAGPKAAKL